jgi:hypothetical protein
MLKFSKVGFPYPEFGIAIIFTWWEKESYPQYGNAFILDWESIIIIESKKWINLPGNSQNWRQFGIHLQQHHHQNHIEWSYQHYFKQSLKINDRQFNQNA